MLLGTPYDDASVVAAEPERVAHGGSDVQISWRVWDVIEITGFVRIVQIDGRRRDAIADGQNTGHQFNPPTRAEQVSGGALGAAYG